MTDGRELAYLEALPPPVIHADGNPEHRRIQPRYVVVHQSGIARATHQEYVARTGALHRSGVRVTPRESKVIYVWKTPEPDDAVLLGLQRRAARVGYLGGSDSPVRLRVATGMPRAAPIDRFTPDREGDTRINVVAEGHVAALDRFYEACTDRGASVSRLQFPALQHQAVYRSPGFDSGVDIGEVVAWLLLRPAMPGRRISMVSALFKGGDPQPLPAPSRGTSRNSARSWIQWHRLRTRPLLGASRCWPYAIPRADTWSGALAASGKRCGNPAERASCGTGHRKPERPRRRRPGRSARRRTKTLGSKSEPMGGAVETLVDRFPGGSRAASVP